MVTNGPLKRTDNNSEESDTIDIDAYYQSFRREFEKRNITDGVLLRDVSDEDEQYEWISYQYKATETRGLSVYTSIDSYRIELFVGPIQIDVALPENSNEIPIHVAQLLDIIQLFLNGQLALVITCREKDDSWQAAELVYTTKKGVEKTISVIAHYSHARSSLYATTLRNQLKYPSLALDSNTLLRPVRVNNRELIGRHIDLATPAPLTHKMYTQYDNDMIVQHLGGESGEALWELFYRRIDFWIICIFIGTPAVWLLSITPDSSWWMHLIFGPIAVLLIAFLTGFMLARRQAIVDSGKIPFTERLEEVIQYRLISAFWALTLIATFFFVPIWTTRENPQLLLPALQVPQITYPLLLSCICIFTAMVLIQPTSKARKVARTILMTLGYGGVLFCNFGLLYSGDDAAAPADYIVYIITILPIAVIFWYICDCFRRKTQRAYGTMTHKKERLFTKNKIAH